ncbi:MAG: formate dehydrogenase accessory sulfurtransferase FdhD [Bacteroidota bacterium]
MTKPSVSAYRITRIIHNQFEKVEDLLAVEEPLEIRLGYGPADMREQKSISVTMRTPGHDFELALGFLFTENIIQSPTQIYKIHYCTEANTIENKENIVRVELQPDVAVDLSKLQRNFYTTSSCGVCGKESIEAVMQSCPVITGTNLNVSPHIITHLPDTLRASQNVFEHTGGLHACALFNSDGKLLMLREDVGRHNAMDKLVGAMLASHPDTFSQSILLLSGRASFELLQKAAMAQVPIVCAVGAPSNLAVQTAEEFGITLIGFLRGERFNVYTHAERITR